MSDRDTLCECGHKDSHHGEQQEPGVFRRCRSYGCNCPHFGVLPACRACAATGIAFDAPPRVREALLAGVKLVNDGNLINDGLTCTARVSTVWPGIRAVYRLEARLSRGFGPAEAAGQGVIDLMLDAGQWLCWSCYGSGRRHDAHKAMAA